jgi:hypothetical protein
MKNKEKYYKLDEVGFVGVQKKSSTSSQSYHKKKTGEAIRQLRKETTSRNSYKVSYVTR